MVLFLLRCRSSSTRSEIFTPVPDSIIASSISSTQHANALDATLDGVETPISAATPLPSDLMKLGQARYKVLGQFALISVPSVRW